MGEKNDTINVIMVLSCQVRNDLQDQISWGKECEVGGGYSISEVWYELSRFKLLLVPFTLFQGEAGADGEPTGEGGGEGAKKKSGKPEKRLRNQFNFSERASQTLNNPYRVSSRFQWMSTHLQCTVDREIFAGRLGGES